MNTSLTLDPAGRVVLPAAVRKALGLNPGSRLLLSVEGQVVTLTPMREAIRKAQAILAPYRPKDGSLMSDALVAERREEYRKELEADMAPLRARGAHAKRRA
ncbi:MAG: AbrB/MazE/SpoVT family DNA-binding domain-containing protein [Holophagaceae bacterium]